jgi:glycosyltransferase involved in cell wall biosynthesis
MPDFWINTTTTNSWRGAFVGIPRIENELSKELNFKKFSLDHLGNTFLNLEKQGSKEYIRIEPDKKFIANRHSDFLGYAVHLSIGKRILRIFGYILSFCYGRNRHIDTILNKILEFSAPIWNRVDRVAPRANEIRKSTRTTPMNHPFSDGDVVTTLGLDWDSNSLEKLIEIKKNIRILIITVIYDLIPINKPEYILNRRHSIHLLRHFTHICRYADVIIVNSHHVESQVTTLIENLGLQKPRIEILPWSSSIEITSTSKMVENGTTKIGEPYFLFVGTIEIRKNHRLICSVIYLAAQLGISLPKFVFVGRLGWGTTDLMSEINNSKLLSDSILLIEDADDFELKSLMTHCLGLVSPSFDEGYGLPVLEALILGKHVYLSDIPIYRELFPNAVFASPHDPAAWLANFNQEPGKAEPEQMIIPTWKFIAGEFRRIANSLVY